MKVAILGFGAEGESAYRYWKGMGADVVIHDADAEVPLPPGSKSVLGPGYLNKFDGYDLIVRSAQIRPWDVKSKTPVTTALREFMGKCPARVIGVTGTRGKSTTCMLIGRILGEAGWRNWLGGEVGVQPLDFLSKVRASHLVVLEMPTFELMDLDVSPHIGVCLAITPGSMDLHRSLRESVAAKGNIFWHQKTDDVAVYDARNEFATQIGQLSPGRKLPYSEAPGARVVGGRLVAGNTDICGTDEVGLRGPHNLENICAAVTAVWDLISHNPAPVQRALKGFTGLVHRLEEVREVSGVRYFDDSASNVPETTMAALRSFEEPKVVILGGASPVGDYRELAQAVAGGNVRHAVLVGEAAEKLATALEDAGFRRSIVGPRTMAEIVGSARALAQQGDVVLLSPACPASGLFKNYRDRGDQFKKAVKALG